MSSLGAPGEPRSPQRHSRLLYDRSPPSFDADQAIPSDFTEADLCAEYGTIICRKIMINLDTGEGKCFGFAAGGARGDPGPQWPPDRL
jgi:hypothetical protein